MRGQGVDRFAEEELGGGVNCLFFPLVSYSEYIYVNDYVCRHHAEE
jgi:hypothetical protein